MGVSGSPFDLPVARLDEVGEVHQPVLVLEVLPVVGEFLHLGGHLLGGHHAPEDLVEVHQPVARGLVGGLQVVLIHLLAHVGRAQAELHPGLFLVPLLEVFPPFRYLGLSQRVVAVAV